MQKILASFLWTALFFSLLSGCSLNTPEPSAVDVSMPTDLFAKDSAADVSAEDQHILDTLDLCAEFVEGVTSRYPEIPLHLDSDEIEWYYAELDSSSPDYAAMEAQLSILTLRLRQSVHARIDNILKMGNAVPDGLYDLLEAYDERFATLGW